jgi:hypothetical protein
MNNNTSLHPIALCLTVASAAQLRSRPQYQGGVQVVEYVLQVWAERSGTDYRAEYSVGFGASAAVVGGIKAAAMKPGVVIKVLADRQRVVTGKKPRIELVGITQIEPLHQMRRDYHETEHREAA